MRGWLAGRGPFRAAAWAGSVRHRSDSTWRLRSTRPHGYTKNATPTTGDGVTLSTGRSVFADASPIAHRGAAFVS